MRGDGGRRQARRRARRGSPPRAWGRLAVVAIVNSFGRFTPTCVGTARRMRTARLRPSVHPHVRGDGAQRQSDLSRCAGSPPRAWGRHNRAVVVDKRTRFTPTCVGTASRVLATRRVETVHPHVRGDGGMGQCVCVARCGSPPRAWGRPALSDGPRLAGRFTPTCVGTARRGWLRGHAGSVHPHVRGDGYLTGLPLGLLGGSPPRAWGRHGHRGPRRGGRRFTPTCVGTAQSLPTAPNTRTVHPHVRGDGSSTDWITPRTVGSPPRAWGRRHSYVVGPSDVRFTPTCVGTARASRRSERAYAVHPHVRGDGFVSRFSSPPCLGSPPRAWGRREVLFGIALGARFTPTCVGTAA